MIAPNQFELSAAQQDEIRASLRQQFLRGLGAPDQQVASLPTYLAPPRRQSQNKCIVIDCGGTNIRAALVALDPQQNISILAGPVEASVPPSDANSEAKVFFDQHVSLVKQLGDVDGLPLGYCFSYPSLNNATGDATLLKWTKGLQFKGVVGSLVGQQLQKALLAAGIKISRVKVLNDTVAALFAGKFTPNGHSIGLIVGTGFNIAAFVNGRRVKKCLQWSDDIPMAINLESGNFSPPHLLDVDDELDRASINPGEQRYEKAVSGMYLPQLFRLCCPRAEIQESAAELVKIRDESPHTDHGKFAAAILGRSADLVACGLAGVVDVLSDDGNTPGLAIHISAEGSLFWGDSHFRTRVSNQMNRLLPKGYSLEISRTEHANLIGAARAASL